MFTMPCRLAACPRGVAGAGRVSPLAFLPPENRTQVTSAPSASRFGARRCGWNAMKPPLRDLMTAWSRPQSVCGGVWRSGQRLRSGGLDKGRWPVRWSGGAGNALARPREPAEGHREGSLVKSTITARSIQGNRIQRVVTRWIPGFTASGRRPIVMINPNCLSLRCWWCRCD